MVVARTRAHEKRSLSAAGAGQETRPHMISCGDRPPGPSWDTLNRVVLTCP